eukprot:CAMPEP_0182447460 /NCGR_PEP_ID=MMETSP1172-20130603/16274_1 /TAXON_ID=708627 /ORGANISM="Timspurckia oligopyrenoides, Strain CCMP3278" /LENGTH=551 /DNA_ID=CAMNT_0024643905 /DNA_START=142 /DNA_END=1797 /DNA_ORIENTATION=+
MMNRVSSGTGFCEMYTKHSAKKSVAVPEFPGIAKKNVGMKRQVSPIRQEELLKMIDLLFEQADLSDNASEQEVVKKLGKEGLQTVLKLYNLATSSPYFSSNMLDEEVAEITSNSSQSSADVTSAFEVPDVDSTPLKKKQRRVSKFEVPELTSIPETKPLKKEYKSETEIAVSRIFELGKVAPVLRPEIEPTAPYNGPPVLTMTGFGELGRWGNQILQYAFLVSAAQKTGAKIQVPYWVGTDIFNLDNSLVERRLPAVIEDRTMKANSTFTDSFMEYIRASNGGKTVPEVFQDVLNPESSTQLKNSDVWGWFQWPTQQFLPHKQLILKTFAPIPALENHFQSIITEKLRPNGQKTTVVGLHLRLGDYKNIAASSFGYCAPTSWYLDWLAKIWPTLENPVLFVASDEIDTVLRDFAAYNPVTADMLGCKMPEEYQDLKAGFFPDWYMLTQCDVLAISNSTFSFTACMMNRRENAQFYRAHYEHRIQEFDPWNADPIVHREMGQGAISEIGNTLKILYETQGTRGVMKNVLYELPYYGIRSVVMKAVLKARTMA